MGRQQQGRDTPRPPTRPPPPRGCAAQRTLQGELARSSHVASTVAGKLEAQRETNAGLEHRLGRLTGDYTHLLK